MDLYETNCKKIYGICFTWNRKRAPVKKMGESTSFLKSLNDRQISILKFQTFEKTREFDHLHPVKSCLPFLGIVRLKIFLQLLPFLYRFTTAYFL